MINHFPDVLANCKDMDNDFAAISDWASVFTDPLTLAKKVSKNWLLHEKKVKADIA